MAVEMLFDPFEVNSNLALCVPAAATFLSLPVLKTNDSFQMTFNELVHQTIHEELSMQAFPAWFCDCCFESLGSCCQLWPSRKPRQPLLAQTQHVLLTLVHKRSSSESKHGKAMKGTREMPIVQTFIYYLMS